MTITPDAIVPVPPPIVPTEPAKERGHLAFIDGLRATLALIVVINHAYQEVYWNRTTGLLSGATGQWFIVGHYAVVAFIVVSGFCLMLPVIKRGALKGNAYAFFEARAWRILPAYWGALALSLLLIALFIGHPTGTMFDLALPITKTGIFNHALLINNLWGAPQLGDGGNPQINPVFWTIALEWQIYFWFPLLVAVWKRLGILATGALTLPVVALVFHVVSNHHQWHGLNLYGINPQFYAYFVLGMLAACIVYEGPKVLGLDRLPWKSLGILLLLGWPLMYASMLANQVPNVVTLETYSALTAVAILVAGCRGGMRLFSWGPLPRVGLYSYSIYLLHLPLLALVTDVVILRLPSWSPVRQFVLLLCLALPLILFCSKWFSRLFEDRKALQSLLGHLKRSTR